MDRPVTEALARVDMVGEGGPGGCEDVEGRSVVSDMASGGVAAE